MVTNEDFGKRFKHIRLEKGVTEKEMGKAIGHTEKYPQVYRYGAE